MFDRDSDQKLAWIDLAHRLFGAKSRSCKLAGKSLKSFKSDGNFEYLKNDMF